MYCQMHYTVNNCPSCGQEFSKDEAIKVDYIDGEGTKSFLSRLSCKGLLIDKGLIIASGMHAGTSCSKCEAQIDDFEEIDDCD